MINILSKPITDIKLAIEVYENSISQQEAEDILDALDIDYQIIPLGSDYTILLEQETMDAAIKTLQDNGHHVFEWSNGNISPV